MGKKRETNYRPDWDVYFMSLALNAARRASCYHIRTGCVIVKDKRVLATGYNGASPRIKSCLEQGCRKEFYEVDFKDKGRAICRGTHAEMNALLKAGERSVGASLYSFLYPCSSCAKHIDAAGIERVYWGLIYQEKDSLTDEIFKEAGIAMVQIDLKKHIKKLHQIDLKLLAQ